MKRPLTVSLIVLVTGFSGGLSLIFLITSQLGFYIFPLQKEIWQNYFPGEWYKVWFFTLVVLPAVYGLYRGKPWARNIFFFLLIIWILDLGRGVIQLFAISSKPELSGLAKLYALMNILLLSISLLMFYLLLRPEVGKFCRAYPQTRIKSNQSSLSD